LVGESGSGKSVTALSLLHLIQKPGKVEGQVDYSGEDVRRLDSRQLRKIRGGEIAIIFQEPMMSFNPVYKVGDQVFEAIRLHRPELKPKEGAQEVIKLFEQVGLSDAQRRYHNYPHELSGGMLQRVGIAMALSGKPKVLIADEPTTALDVTIQAQILSLLQEIIRKQGLSLLLITHDLGVVAEVADRIAVMYAGKIVEMGDTRTFFSQPGHPYSKALFDALPSFNEGHELTSIPGNVPDLQAIPEGCAFHERCPRAQERCFREIPELKKRNGHKIACFYPISY
jgi:oligopeptide/dipeptide ABC transporter ATP-binding protein